MILIIVCMGVIFTYVGDQKIAVTVIFTCVSSCVTVCNVLEILNQQALHIRQTMCACCVKVEVAFLGSPSLTVSTVCVDGKQQ